jgi:hypothetical protein
MKYRVDIDGVLCTNTSGKYEAARPLKDNILKVNQLYEDGHEIILWTARGATTGKDWRRLTEAQMALWQVRYHELHLDKPYYDLLIDDRSRRAP